MTCGPDHRDHAPELEWNGDIATLASAPEQSGPIARACTYRHLPLDGFAVAGPWEAARDLLTDSATTRLTPGDAAAQLLDAAARARRADTVSLQPALREARSVQRECIALADLAEYHAHKLRAATALAVYQGSAAEPWLTFARSEMTAARAAWSALVTHTSHLAPFTDNLRMVYLGLARFHWRSEQAWVDGDLAVLETAAAAVRLRPPAFRGTLPVPAAWAAETRADFPAVVAPTAWNQSLSSDRGVRVTFAADLPAGTRVNLLWKSINARDNWRALPATVDGATVTATIPGDSARVLVALEVLGARGVARRLPDPRAQTPYWIFSQR